jgi:hypothetical protein
MRLLLKQNRVLSSLLFTILVAIPVLAHEVEVASDVAATLHIEPNDRPLANVPSKVWFALTRKGGQIIPLSQCDCKLAVYSVPHQKGKTPPLMQPSLVPLNVERYNGIPGATIAFPKAGMYDLELTGTAKPGANFQPFTLSFQVMVGK